MKKVFAVIPLAALAVIASCSDARTPTSSGAEPFAHQPLFDQIPNDLDGSVDASAEEMPLVVGGAKGTTQLYVVPTKDDGKNGCNLTGSTTLVVSVSSSNTAVATVSPSSITFTSCGNTPTLTVTPHGV